MAISRRILWPALAALAVTGLILGAIALEVAQSSEGLRAEVEQLLRLERDDLSTPLPSDILADQSDRSLLHLRRGDLLALRGEWAKAKGEYEASIEAGGGLTALRKLAVAQLQVRDVNGVQATIRSLEREGARPEDILLLQSIVDLRTGNIAGADSRLGAATDSPQKHYGLALLAILQGDHEKAQAELKLTEAGSEPTLRSYARTLIEAYDEYRAFPESPAVHLQTLLARALAEVQECELALPLLVSVLEQQTDYRDAWIVQGYCELTSERLDQALASLSEAYKLDPEKPEILYLLARAYAAKGQHVEALQFFQYALQNGFQPQDDVERRIAEEAVALGNPQLALEQFRAISSRDGATIDDVTTFVTTAIALDQKEEAYTAALQATQKWTTDARAFDLLGFAAMETDRKDEARGALQKALELDPNLQSAKERLQKL